jgi:endonuclease I
MRYLFLFVFVFFCFPACGKPIVDKQQLHDEITRTHTNELDSYALARKYLFGELHYNNGIVTDVYCEQNYNSEHGVGYGKIPDPNFLNCEHTWPQSKFGTDYIEAKKNDLHHLYPATAFANSARSNHPFGELRKKNFVCGKSYKGKIIGSNEIGFEPSPKHRGNVARAMFYFSIRYEMPIDEKQEATLRKWHLQDPVDEFEFQRNKKIQVIQGNINPFILNPELVDTIENF